MTSHYAKVSVTRGVPDPDRDRSVCWAKPVGDAEPQGIRCGATCAKSFREDECGISVHEILEGQGLGAGRAVQQ